MAGASDRGARERPQPAKGESLGADAWKRLRRNRLAVASAGFILLVAALGYGAPLVARHVTHFAMAEQHTRLAYAPPGTKAVSFAHPTYDGDPSSFDAVDLDDDGRIACRRKPAKEVALPGMRWMAEHTPTLRAWVERRLDALDEELPVRSLLRHRLGRLECPELDTLTKRARYFDFLFDRYDVATGAAEPEPGRTRPDGWITWREFPKTEAELRPAHRGSELARPLVGPEAFRWLDVNGDHAIARWEVTRRTRHMRFQKEDLLRRFDANDDLAIDRSEYPGAPELHTFWAGTDGKGRDVLTRLLYGARISITIGLLATLVSLVIGVTWGAVSGFYGGWVDHVMMRIVDMLYGLPFMFIVILLIAVVGRSTLVLFVALGAVQWLSMARVIRGQVISLKEREFIEAAQAIGLRRPAIIFRHLMPNSIGPVIVYATLLVPAVIVEEAFLSFLGLGVQPPNPSWGNMITAGASEIRHATWLILWPGLALATTLFAMNFLGDGVRDAMDPQLQKDG